MKKLLLLLIIGFIVAGCIQITPPTNTSHSNSNTPAEPQPCTLEAKLCPDGSSVGRVGPDCEFAPCPEELKQSEINFAPMSSDVSGAAKVYNFSSEIPISWRVEAVPAIEALSIYDPAAPGDTNLEKSQIFIRYFSANTFLTLSTVTIHSKQDAKIAGRPAVVYDIEKKREVAKFPNQPQWRSERHIVTDIRVSDSNPSIFYVIAKRPDLAQEIYDHVLNTFQFKVYEQGLVPPIDNFHARITKKPFGIYITPEDSPVQPERFTGYHNAADVEYADVSGTVPVRATADGIVERSGWVSGYGGMAAIRHQINGESLLAIYGHLDPAKLPAVKSDIKAGETIGELGDGGTPETDGERKHLHFGLYTGSDTNISGYVTSKAALSQWRDPLTIIE